MVGGLAAGAPHGDALAAYGAREADEGRVVDQAEVEGKGQQTVLDTEPVR